MGIFDWFKKEDKGMLKVSNEVKREPNETLQFNGILSSGIDGLEGKPLTLIIPKGLKNTQVRIEGFSGEIAAFDRSRIRRLYMQHGLKMERQMVVVLDNKELSFRFPIDGHGINAERNANEYNRTFSKKYDGIEV